MSNINILGEIKWFLDNPSPKSLEIVFDTLEIQTFTKGMFLHSKIKKAGKIRVHMAEQNGMPQMEVLDHLVFQFSFQFPHPKDLPFFETTALVLPRPLTNGFLRMDSEKIQLEFTIDAPNENSQVHVKHFYMKTIQVRSIDSKFLKN